MISQFDDLIYNAVSSFGWPTSMNQIDFIALINAVIQRESSFNPAVSPDGDHIGLMQISSSIYGYAANILYDPANNINIGTNIIKDLINQYGLAGALGAYRLGPVHRFEATAVAYASSVMSYWQNFKATVAALFSKPVPTVQSGEYYVGPDTTQADFINNLPFDPIVPTQLVVDASQPLDTATVQPSATDPTAAYSPADYVQAIPSQQVDNTWIWLAVAAFVIVLVLSD